MITAKTYHAEADLYIRSHARFDGDFGVVLRPGSDEWTAWETYFERKNFRAQRSFMKVRAQAEATYTVPSRWPWEFDPTYTRR